MSALTVLSLAAMVAAPSAPARAPAFVESVGSSQALVSAYMNKLGRESSLGVVAPSDPIPSFSRQTGLACSACHTSFPQLNAFGRLFKLNGYTMTAAQTVQAKSNGKTILQLDRSAPISLMAVTSLTQVSKAVPGQQNGSLAFPQQMSVFYGGAITPKIGTFIQLTYDPADGTIGMDNTDIRFADHTTVSGKDFLYGFDLNNSPTVEDVWNSTPAWGYPFTASDVAPGPMASTLIDGNLAQSVMGAGAYGLWDHLVYADFSVYRSAFQGGPEPVDATASDAIQGVAPYWRVALQHDLGSGQIEVGTYGMVAHLVPSGFTGTYDTYRDAAVDAQYDMTTQAGASFVAHGTYIHENRSLDATFAAGGATQPAGNLSTARVDATYYWPSRLGLTAGYFSTQGDTDPLLYPQDPVDGSATGSPDSRGYILQASYMPWLNTRVGLQYVGYTMFNGASSNYDGAGRNASNNNTLYLMTWVAF